jgi:hypothetical protein
MRNAYRVIAASVMLLACAAVSSTPNPAFRLTIASPVTKVSLRQSFPIQVALANAHENRRLVIHGSPGFAEEGGIRIEVAATNGPWRRVAPANSGRLTRRNDHRSTTRVMAPGEAIGMHHRVHAADLFRAPGRYRLRAVYEASSSSGNAPVGVSNAIRAGNAVSDELAIEVIQ